MLYLTIDNFTNLVTSLSNKTLFLKLKSLILLLLTTTKPSFSKEISSFALLYRFLNALLVNMPDAAYL